MNDRAASLEQASFFDRARSRLRLDVPAALADPVFLADAVKRDLPVQAITGAEVQKVVTSVIATPKDVIAMLKRSVEEAKASAGK